MSAKTKAQVKVTSRTVEGQKVFEGTVTLPGVKPTKLVKKSDQSTRFSTRSAVVSAAKGLARTLGVTLELIPTATTTTTTTRRAAKRTVGKRR